LTEVYTLYEKFYIHQTGIKTFPPKLFTNCIKSDGKRILYFTKKKVLGKFGIVMWQKQFWRQKYQN